MTGASVVRRGASRVGLASIALVAVVTAAATGAVLTGVFASGVGAGPALPPHAVAGQPVVEQIAVGDRHARVVVVPHRPGRNLVWVDGDGYRVGPAGWDLVPAKRRPGAAGAWAMVDLPAGPSTLRVEHGDSRAMLPLNADFAVPELPAITTADGPECLSAVVGAAMAKAPPPSRCPNRTLAPADRKALRGMLRSLADRSVPGIRLVGGDSPRANAAETLVRRLAAQLDLPVDGPPHPLDARVVVGDWATAERALARQTRDPARSGVYLAPWLANGTLLGYSTGAVVVLNYDTTAGEAAKYVAALDSFATRELASPAGFTAWLTGSGRPVPTGPARLYAALAGFSLMGVDPEMRNGHHAHDAHKARSQTGGWIPRGRMATVSKPLDTS